MRTLRRHRRWLLPWVAAALLWTQWLAVAHACTVIAVPAHAAAVDSLLPMAHMPGCTGHEGAAAQSGDGASPDPGRQQLCKAHCQAGQQSVNSQAGVLDAPPALLLGAALVGLVAPAEPSRARCRGAEARAAGPPRGAPPLYLSLLVLRN
jgi:hypothetical protein